MFCYCNQFNLDYHYTYLFFDTNWVITVRSGMTGVLWGCARTQPITCDHAMLSLCNEDIVTGCDAQYQYRSDSNWHTPQDNHFEVYGAVGASIWQREWRGVKCKLCNGWHTW